jgi:hypothetical protein
VDHLKRHLSVANVLSCLALFVALSGAAYAATLGKSSVKTRHLAKGAVTTQKLRNGAVTTPKLRNAAVIATKIATGNVGSTQLADGGVRSVDLGGGVVTTGKLKNGAVTNEKLANDAVSSAKIGVEAVKTGHIEAGAVTGAKLAPNLLAQLVKNVFYVMKTSAPSSETKTEEVECTPSATRKQVLGGGARIIGSTKVALSESVPKLDAAGNRVGWTVSAVEVEEELGNWSLEVHAICAEF